MTVSSDASPEARAAYAKVAAEKRKQIEEKLKIETKPIKKIDQ